MVSGFMVVGSLVAGRSAGLAALQLVFDPQAVA